MQRSIFGVVLSIVLLGVSTDLRAQAEFDAMSPKTDKADALALPLHTVTIATNSLEESLHFYRDSLGMTAEGPIQVEDSVLQTQRLLWELEADETWDLYLLTRPGADVAQIRLLVMHETKPSIHKSWNSMELGTFSMGFPNDRQVIRDREMRQAGYGALNVIEIYDVPRTDGAMYEIQETIYNGPDFVHAVGIHRADGMPQLGALDANGLGGPAYSAQVIEDSEAVLGFYTEVLGMELRSDRTWKSAGTDGAMNLPDGTIFRFSIVFAKGYSPGGHLLFVDFENIDAIDTGVPSRLPNRGIGLWSFPTDKLDRILENAAMSNTPVIHGPVIYDSPTQGTVRVATLLAPNNFVVEIFEQVED